ncbi:hypothetical protein NO559_16435 [Dasania sp. GY-MA-18]|uniref:hypothetical protein n=1 Tax=Dasania sp. GY-MA-18 TaxID=2966584 RepID=UPI0021ACB492|nr:hypothetical protein [Dasania sp. GY-MA-18]MCR8924362.1 hypothetical protein [Dasania sp. GY-MA-18]
MYAMLSLDLDKNTSSEERNKFYEYLKNEKWTKIPKVTTTWYAKFKDGGTESGATQATKSDVDNAAKHAGVTSYDAVVNVSESKPTSF